MKYRINLKNNKIQKKSKEIFKIFPSETVEISLQLYIKPSFQLKYLLTRSLLEPSGPCTQSMEISESRSERVD